MFSYGNGAYFGVHLLLNIWSVNRMDVYNSWYLGYVRQVEAAAVAPKADNSDDDGDAK